MGHICPIGRYGVNNASFAFFANKLVVVYAHEVTLINLTRNSDINILPSLSNKGNACRVILNENGIYILNCLPETDQLLDKRYGGGGRQNQRNESGSNNSFANLSLSNKTWVNLTPSPQALVSPLVVSHKQYLYVLGCQHGSMSHSLVFRYCTANDTWTQCNNFPTRVSGNNADVLVHDDAIKVFTATTRFRYIEDFDSWISDRCEMTGDLVNVFVKGNAIRCVTRQKTGYGQPNYVSHAHGAYHHGANHAASAMDTQKNRYYLQTYDVGTKQWIDREQMDLGDKEPIFFF